MDRERPRNAFAMLDASHRRHDQMLDQLLGAAERLASGAGRVPEMEECTDAVAFFARSVPNHFGDEDEVVFPAIVRAHPHHGAALAALSAEHPGLIAAHAAVREAVAAWNDSVPGAVTAASFIELARDLAARYRDHAVREDTLLATIEFEDPEGAILAAMEARRGGGRGRGGGGGGGGGRNRLK